MDPYYIAPQKDLTAAYVTVANYLCTKYKNPTVNSDQVRAITHRALEFMKAAGDTTISSWSVGVIPADAVKQHLLDVVEKILLSGDTPWKPKISPELRIQNLVFQLIRGDIPSPSSLLREKGLLSAVFWKKNPELLQEAKDVLKLLFVDIVENSSKNISDDENARFHMEVLVADLLSLYPFLGPKENEELKVPLWLDGKWQLITYQTEPIRLTPKWMGSSMMAFGLNPIGNEKAPPLLLFKGTTYLTDKGFSLSLLADLNPFASVGTYSFYMGKGTIKAWFDKQKHKANVYGKSLGGAQSLRCVLNFPEKVEKVMTIGSPGFHSRDLKAWDRIIQTHPHDHPQIHMVSQMHDIIPLVDNVADSPGVSYYQVIGERPQKGVIAHAGMAVTNTRSVIIRLDPSLEAKKTQRYVLTFLKVVISPLAFTVLLLGHILITMLKKIAKLSCHTFKRIFP